MTEQPIIIERTFDADVATLWQALTDKDIMKQWYFDIAVFKPEVGFEFSFVAGQPDGIQYVHLCEVTEAIPQNKLTYSWRYEGYEGISHVTFELFPEGAKTKLKLTHSGIESFPKSNKDLVRGNFEAGWDSIINQSLYNFFKK